MGLILILFYEVPFPKSIIRLKVSVKEPAQSDGT